MAPRWIDACSRFAGITQVEPYIDLTFGTDEPGFLPCERQRPWATVVLRLQGISAADFAEGRFHPDPVWQEWWQKQVHVPALYRRPVAGLADLASCTAQVRHAEFFNALRTNRSVQDAVAQVTLGQLLDDEPPAAAGGAPEAERPDPADEPAGEPEPGTVVIGIIDDGLAFAHERFRLSPYETRIEHLWLQDREKRDPEGSQLPYGRELRKAEIDGLLRHYQPAGLVDEDDLYRRAGAIDFSQRRHQSLARRAAHGSHVMDLACGFDFRQGPRHDRPIVCVQLPAATTEDTSGATLDDYGLDAIRYILDRADAIARRRASGRLPVVINLSYGNVAGPHDGTSDLELAIDDLLRARRASAPCEVVLPSGNSNLGRLHAEVRFDQPSVDLHWRALPDDATPSFIEIWLPRADPKAPWNPGDPSRMGLRVMAPSGELSGPLEETSGAGMQLTSNGEEVLCEVRYRYVPAPTNRGMFLVALQPTTRVPGLSCAAQPVAASGVWTVRLENRSLAPDALVQAWIQRDDTPFGFRRRGRQSYFDERCYKRFFDAECKKRLPPNRILVQGRAIEDDADQPPCRIKRAGSLNAIATGAETTVIAGRLGKEGRLASYSARGAGATPAALARDSEVSDDSLVHGGVLAAGTRSGSTVALRGTSVAAPQRTRELADQLAPPAKGSVVSSPPIARPRRFR